MKMKGFTLIEVVASLVIVGIALVAILGMFSIANRVYINPELNKEKVIAYNLLQRKMEEIRAQDFGDINDASNEVYSDFSTYSLDTDVTDLSSDLKSIEVTITWTNAFGDTVTETISTKVTEWERERVSKKTGKGKARGFTNRKERKE